MSGPNDFTNQNIEDTYQRVLQISSSNVVTDGTGSELPIKIEGDNVRVTGDIIATQYVVSSSVTNITTQQLSGSTEFGDSTDDTHQFSGSMVVHGQISSSGNTSIVKAANFYSPAFHTTDNNFALTVVGDTKQSGNISASGDISASALHLPQLGKIEWTSDAGQA